ncbi:hypothetical protein TNCV_562341 [Trichonephila clavipes]|nr:hypothetical protein TNCV_562341 [Trichonephila clavipes]
MTCCVVVHKNKFITDSTTEKTKHEEVELHQSMYRWPVIVHSGNHMPACAAIDHDAGPHQRYFRMSDIGPFPGYFLDDERNHSVRQISWRS